MNARQAERLRRTKEAVAGALGGRWAQCHHCRGWFPWPWVTDRSWKARRLPTLQVDHPKGRRYSIRTLNTLQRWGRYLREALAGLVKPACAPCNRLHGGAVRYKRRRHAPRGGR